MATVTKLKAEVNNKNLPILGEDGNLYSYYFGNYFNKVVESGYTPTSNETNALEAFVQDGISNGWIDAVKYFLPLLGDSTHLSAAIVPLIDTVGNYAMAEYTGEENFANSMVLDSNNKVKYFGYTGSGTFQYLKTPCSFEDCHKGICFSGYMPYPMLRDEDFDRYAVLNKSTKQYFSIRYSSIVNAIQYMYLKTGTDEAMTAKTVYHPNSDKLTYLNENEIPLVVTYGLYKNSVGECCRLRSWLDREGSGTFNNAPFAESDDVSYPDYSDLETVKFGNTPSGEHMEQAFGCLAVLDSVKCTKQVMAAYNNAVFELMTALNK